MDVLSLPHYDDAAAGTATDELPPYSRRQSYLRPRTGSPRQTTEHVFTITDSRNRPWAKLTISSSAKSVKSLPTFFDKDAINGTLELNADEKGDSIHAINATITGRIITSASSNDSTTFLSHTVPLWNRAPDGSCIFSPSPGVVGPRLRGHCVWPFSIPIPRTAGDARLPETFVERHTSVSVQYEFCITIARGKLRSDNQIKTTFGYVPSTRPDPPSMLRQISYQQGTPIPGPQFDPEGWHICPSVVSRGCVFKSRHIEVRCTLALALPLAYTRGSVIPCRLQIEGQDPQSLDLLSTPSAIVLCLQRRVHTQTAPSPLPFRDILSASCEDVGRAVWWPVNQSCHGEHAYDRHFVREFEGEISLSKDLKPSAAIGPFSLSYEVVLKPFDTAGFTPEPPVEITTMYAKGPVPRPRVYAPPEYASSPRDYDA
ncbi:hypothetical protein FISHEDRAFT_36554 [Fistulina hepatica ATCC 64428]|uniref:Arrestin-like N-terminal domain-containing protein n=1 Tax=Fistulina hepatica ATCC 64428 TaxID=1128425 RepID=A0A0D7AJQ3_9AGAR|nr:hypothetical protein FISHEDRAFT_36554 [Fistulina hepatica ATCC 64428]